MNTLYLVCWVTNYHLRYAALNSGSAYLACLSSLFYLVIGRRGPLRVRAFVLVRCPRSGKPRR